MPLADVSLEPFWSLLPASGEGQRNWANDVAVYDDAFRAAHDLESDATTSIDLRLEARRTLFGPSDTGDARQRLTDEAFASECATFLIDSVATRSTLPTINLDTATGASSALAEAYDELLKLAEARPQDVRQYKRLRDDLTSRYEAVVAAHRQLGSVREEAVAAFNGFDGATAENQIEAAHGQLLAELTDTLRPFLDLPTGTPVAGTLREEISRAVVNHENDLETWRGEQMARLQRLRQDAGVDGEDAWLDRLANAKRLSEALLPMDELLASAGTAFEGADLQEGLATFAQPADEQSPVASVDSAARRYAMLRVAVDRLPADANELTQRIAAGAARVEPTRPPFVKPGDAYAPTYDPTSLGRMLVTMDATRSAIDADVGQSTALPPRALLLADANRRLEESVTPYLADYLAYWAGQVEQELVVDETPGPWSTDFALISKPERIANPLRDTASWYGKVDESAESSKRLLDLDDELPNHQPIKRAVEQFEQLAADVRRDDLDELKAWQQLGADPEQAALLAGKNGPGDMASEYLVLVQSDDPVRNYRKAVTKRLLMSLALANKVGAASSASRLDDMERLRGDIHFPLREVPEGDQVFSLTPDDMRALRDSPLFNKLADFASDVDVAAKPIRSRHGDKAAQDFTRLFLLPSDDLEQLRDAVEWFIARNPEPSVALRVPDEDAQEALGDARASLTYRLLVLNGRDIDFGRIGGDEIAPMTPVFEQDLLLGVKRFRNGDVSSEVSPTARSWHAIEFIDRYFDRADAEGRVITLHIPFILREDVPGPEERPLIVELEFNKPLPAMLIDRARAAAAKREGR